VWKRLSGSVITLLLISVVPPPSIYIQEKIKRPDMQHKLTPKKCRSKRLADDILGILKFNIFRES